MSIPGNTSLKSQSSNQSVKSDFSDLNLGFKVITGFLRCQCKGNLLSEIQSKRTDLITFWLVWFSLFYTTFIIYFCLAVRQDCYSIVKLLENNGALFNDWFPIIIVMATVSLIYELILMVFCIICLASGGQVIVSIFHWALLSGILVLCFILTFLVSKYVPHLWTVAFLSLKIFVPFIHVLSLIISTNFSWIFYRHWFKISQKVERIVWMTIWLFTLSIFYMTPLIFNSPFMKANLAPKPGIIALGGASNVAPENTLIAFEKALHLGAAGLYITLHFSKDQVPMIISDSTVDRTTNFRDQKLLVNSQIKNLSVKDIKSLSAGSWFLKKDPCNTVKNLSSEERKVIKKAGIPTWEEFLTFIDDYPNTKIFVKFNTRDPYNIITQQLAEHSELTISNENQTSVLQTIMVHPQYAHSFIEDNRRPANLSSLEQLSAAFLPLDAFVDLTIQDYRVLNVTTVMQDVNTKWLFSLAWAAGASYVTTYNVELLKSISIPLFYLDKEIYLTIWVSVDVISIVATTISFLTQKPSS
ncbi:glycerophosphodiester phosphodiesterase domain-containing protein 5-like isoform X1 [Biomphalaria glabrata]|uniref:Glycerophosphodiester phosphodiesterase domain-containing protein 5-like isoform X1 n=2 Tax=Biomphalaria glabrata TaxID=6526 RepID=A0A9U8E9U3_BIOGL|nr:glycerophosphodiester phosphodiesterase domain-containing protein 5-like isoform X1 [Biomphalaria glabrata]XP_055869236.1 glycerophosphodiester phosphodiesterase domain-containing protein 5-like isoform X1 [Biomphalaria glabrata]XP_055869237.1 glycerophosphodiester phosphodiesterase domain-containing protein 5-like isoform X1 [Biomphalaria glabrata]KAI8772340.1 glycerophosphodiester phosphodiesterase domain-containing protein 5 isoform X1 [Biomphalaria glabrata]